VAPAARGTGLADALIEACRERCAAHGAHSSAISIAKTSEAADRSDVSLDRLGCLALIVRSSPAIRKRDDEA